MGKGKRNPRGGNSRNRRIEKTREGKVMFPPRARHKTSSARHKNLPFKLLVRKFQETPKTVYPLVVALGCLPELDSKTLLLKTLYTWDTALG